MDPQFIVSKRKVNFFLLRVAKSAGD